MPKVTRTYTITAPDDTLARFEAFLAMLHYNGGHSGYFGLSFDGDGSDTLKVEPAPPKYAAGNKISSVGHDIELALSPRKAIAYPSDSSRKWVSDGEEVWKEGEASVWVKRHCKFAGGNPNGR